MTQEIRTDQQRKALEVYCKKVANTLNDAGIDQPMFWRTVKVMGIDNTQVSVKSLLRNVGKQMFDKDSTADYTLEEYQQLAELMPRAFAERFEVNVPWPSAEELYFESQARHAKRVANGA